MQKQRKLKKEKMLDIRPDLIKEWNFTKNNELNLNINDMTKGSEIKVWWICPKCKSDYEANIYNRVKIGSKCPYCNGKKVNHTNSLFTLNSKLSYEWNYEKNGDLTPHDVTCNRGKKVWWRCKNSHEWEARISSRNNGTSCPYCSNNKVLSGFNDLESSNPLLATEWNYSKNKDLTPDKVLPSAKRKVWWVCEIGHEWESAVYSRSVGTGCPVCTGKQTVIGFNDMWTTNTEMAKSLTNHKDGYIYTQSSSKKLSWKCSCCATDFMSNTNYINNSMKKGRCILCRECLDGISFPEKFVHNLLKECNFKFETEKTFSWSDRKRYDFYLVDTNTIVEVHGSQHYGKGFESVGGRTLADEKNNDKLKYNLAKRNGIENYIVIDAKHSDVEYIRKSILNSEIAKFIREDIDFNKIAILSYGTVIKSVADLWNKYNNIKDVSKELLISENSVKRMLKKASEINLCNYSPINKKEGIKIVQLDLEGNFISEWDSIKEACRENGFKSPNSISMCIKNKRRTYMGFIWIKKEFYDMGD